MKCFLLLAIEQGCITLITEKQAIFTENHENNRKLKRFRHFSRRGRLGVQRISSCRPAENLPLSL
jgi:hypothetical protein